MGTLPAAGMLGTSVPQLAGGIAAGVMIWVGTLTVVTVDVGTAGAGTGVLPCAIPPPLLVAGMMASFPIAHHGMMALPLATAVAMGLSAAFPLGLVTTVHPTVGVGAATATFPGPSAIPSMIAGFSSAGLLGPMAAATATAVGMGLDIAFASFILPIPIVGPPSPSPSSGAGTGKIL